MQERPTLLDGVRGLLVRTYGIGGSLPELGTFIIGHRGLRQFYAAGGPARAAGSAGGCGARTLVRETADGVRACIFFPDELIRTLEAHPPQYGLREENVEAFAVFVEEIDHLLVIAERAAQDRPVSLFELELHADVSKHLVLSRFLAGGARRLSEGGRSWLRERLFDADRSWDGDPDSRERYRAAARWAVRLIETLAVLSPPARLAALRRFHAADGGGKLELIRRLGVS
jgi:hypothetical protein